MEAPHVVRVEPRAVPERGRTVYDRVTSGLSYLLRRVRRPPVDYPPRFDVPIPAVRQARLPMLPHVPANMVAPPYPVRLAGEIAEAPTDADFWNSLDEHNARLVINNV